jgi:hypothetical protein
MMALELWESELLDELYSEQCNLLIWLVKNSDKLWVASSTSKRHGFLRASNSSSWGAAVEGAVCRGCDTEVHGGMLKGVSVPGVIELPLTGVS